MSSSTSNTLFINENQQKLLITFFCYSDELHTSKDRLVDLKHLKLLEIEHAIKYAEGYKKQNVSVLLACEDSRIVDFHHNENNNLSLMKAGQKKKKLEQLLSKTSPLALSGSQFDKALVLGQIIYYSAELTDNLLDCYKKYLHQRAFIRVQICNFINEQIARQTGTVLEKIIPSGCQLSVPGGFSIISKMDLRTIDIVADSVDFDRVKINIKKLLDNKISDKKLAEKINEILVEEFGTSAECSVKSIKIINSTGGGDAGFIKFF